MRHRCSWLTYNPAKPHKWMMKAYELVDACGYLYAFRMYQGSFFKRDDAANAAPVRRDSRVSLEAGMLPQDEPIRPSRAMVGATHGHVLDLLQHLPLNRPFKLFMDNYYTSVGLLLACRERYIAATGTFTYKTSGFPQELKAKKLENKGDATWMTLGGQLGVVKWKDTKDVYVCTNSIPVDGLTTSKLIFFFRQRLISN